MKDNPTSDKMMSKFNDPKFDNLDIYSGNSKQGLHTIQNIITQSSAQGSNNICGKNTLQPILEESKSKESGSVLRKDESNPFFNMIYEIPKNSDQSTMQKTHSLVYKAPEFNPNREAYLGSPDMVLINKSGILNKFPIKSSTLYEQQKRRSDTFKIGRAHV